jgi:hypothetical protein
MHLPVIRKASGIWPLLVAQVFACSSEDPGAITIKPGHGPSLTGPVTRDMPDARGGADGPHSHDARADTADVRVVEDTGPGFFGSNPYTSKFVPMTAGELHAAMCGPPDPGAQMECLSCHDGSMKGTVAFLFAGSIYTEEDGGSGAADVEVRVVDSKGNATDTYSDSDGNFWSLAPGPLLVPAKSGARDAVSEQIMGPSLFNGDCNSCHNGMVRPILHLP